MRNAAYTRVEPAYRGKIVAVWLSNEPHAFDTRTQYSCVDVIGPVFRSGEFEFAIGVDVKPACPLNH